jgi:hypothetical protein
VKGVNKLKLLSVLSVVFILGVSIAGCSSGVSQSEYDLMSNELSTLKTDYQASQDNYIKLQSQFTRLNQYEQVMEICLDAWLVLVGDQSKLGYGKGDTYKWLADVDKKVKAVDDTVLSAMWKAYNAASPGADQFKRGVEMMSYVMDKIKSLSASAAK